MMWLVNTLGFRIHGETLRVDKSYCIFNDYFELPIHQESEIIVPFEHSVELVQTIRDVVLTNNFPVDYITEVLIIMKVYYYAKSFILVTILFLLL